MSALIIVVTVSAKNLLVCIFTHLFTNTSCDFITDYHFNYFTVNVCGHYYANFIQLHSKKLLNYGCIHLKFLHANMEGFQ